ncbi:hypothetical protein MY3957_007901 [Beauveria namnaoensis]
MPLVSAILALVVAAIFAVNSTIAHRASPRHSLTISAYLFISFVADIPRVRTLWLMGTYTNVAVILSSSLAIKLILLWLENIGKHPLLLEKHTNISDEETAGLFSRGLFFWLNWLFLPAAIGCFERIQAFLNEKETQDDRVIGQTIVTTENSASGIALKEMQPVPDAETAPVISVQNATIRWESPVVHNVPFSSSTGSRFIALVGPVASGKSTMINALLGEAQIFSGTVQLATNKLSFCQQTPWLPSGTIRDQIIGDDCFYKEWYDEIVRACALDYAIATLQDGDQSEAGVQGVSLSGGQRQRLAIARALYARKPIAIFDDVLSALDPSTQDIIADKVFGRDGLLRPMNATVWITLAPTLAHKLQSKMFNLFKLPLIAALYYLYVGIVPKSGKRLHLSVLNAALKVPMSFHSKTGIGTLVNRFSHDMQLIDMILPGALIATAVHAASCISVSALATAATPYFAAVLPFILLALGIVHRFYLRTSKQLRLLDHGTGIDLSRVKSFSEDTPIEESPDAPVAHNWPASGHVQFNGVTAAHANFVALHNVSIEIASGERIAVCGRTGSSKSSFISSVLGMMDIGSGSIKLDGQDLGQIDREIVRSRVSYITQDPFLFTGSLRQNLCLGGDGTDAELEECMKAVGLWEQAQKSSGKRCTKTVLDMDMEQMQLSQGQQQLLCLARALLRKSKLVLLDEPTASVDTITEAKIAEVIARKFEDATVIMVTHRLSSIHSFDKVIVLNTGEIVEYGPPAELLSDITSALHQLYRVQSNSLPNTAE